MPLTTLFQWVFDVTIFHEHYTVGQDGSLAFLALIYIFAGLKFVLYDSKQEAKKAKLKELKASLAMKHSQELEEGD